MKTIFLILGLLAPAHGALAHAFNVWLIAGKVSTQSVYDGFRLATRERDGHDFEESDGHLGGLDVNIFSSGPDGPPPPDIDIRVNFEAAALPEISVVREIERIELRPSIAWAAIIALDFQDRFAAEYGRPADDMARRGYYAAQLIDRFVREGSAFTDR